METITHFSQDLQNTQLLNNVPLTVSGRNTRWEQFKMAENIVYMENNDDSEKKFTPSKFYRLFV
ncbi:hypothetical protein V9T40_006877 [Parthenolecanium corni]|uniref:Uncharacterized protein n=1 Tax=Parthenolecanium corni TaxID=536013 RepID=A0AAN9U225_9HEMI